MRKESGNKKSINSVSIAQTQQLKQEVMQFKQCYHLIAQSYQQLLIINQNLQADNQYLKADNLKLRETLMSEINVKNHWISNCMQLNKNNRDLQRRVNSLDKNNRKLLTDLFNKKEKLRQCAENEFKQEGSSVTGPVSSTQFNTSASPAFLTSPSMISSSSQQDVSNKIAPTKK